MDSIVWYVFAKWNYCKKSFVETLQDEKGEANIIAIVLVLAVVVALAFAFRKQVVKIFDDVWKAINKDVSETQNISPSVSGSP